MGIRTNPGYRLYVLSDNLCFSPGKTPKKIYITVEGINRKPGGYFDGKPVGNGTYLVEYYPPAGVWLALTEQFSIIFCLYPAFTEFEVWGYWDDIPSAENQFYFRSSVPCVFSGVNERDSETLYSGDGSFVATTRD